MSPVLVGGVSTTTTRWCPTPEQLMILEEMYRGGLKTPNATQIQHITAHLSLYGRIEGKNVFYWFQNHKARDRQKLRKRLAKHLLSYQQQQQHEQYYYYYYNHHHPSNSSTSSFCNIIHQNINPAAARSGRHHHPPPPVPLDSPLPPLLYPTFTDIHAPPQPQTVISCHHTYDVPNLLEPSPTILHYSHQARADQDGPILIHEPTKGYALMKTQETVIADDHQDYKELQETTTIKEEPAANYSILKLKDCYSTITTAAAAAADDDHNLAEFTTADDSAAVRPLKTLKLFPITPHF